ncbi:MAG: tetratricopeptide repeat protein [Planctomycetota bacterium]
MTYAWQDPTGAAASPATGPAATGAADAAPAGGGVLDWLWSLASRPGVVETLLAIVVVAVVVWTWLRMLRVVEGVRTRALLQDYLLGVEQALSGDLDGAHRRLQRVLEADPENHYARLLLGKVLAQRGDPAQAHKHHLYLQRAFAVESGENDLQLANALLACDRPAEAADAAERVLATDPRNRAALEFLFRARLQASDPEAAAAVGRRLLAQQPNAPTALRRDVAATVAAAGQYQLRRGDLAAAALSFEHARAIDGAASSVLLLGAQVDAARHGAAAVTQRLLTSAEQPAGAPGADPEGAALPVPVSSRAVALGAATAGAGWLAALGPLLPAGRWRCAACGESLLRARARCPRCGAEDRAEVDEPLLFAVVETPAHLADAIEANAAHVRRTVRLALDAADDHSGRAVRGAALALEDKAVGELLAAACGGDGPRADAAVQLLRELGPGITPALFAAADDLEDRRILPLGGSPIAGVVGRVVQGFDREALPHVEALFASARPGSRKILIDYFLGLADPEEFQIVLERFPPLEILHRLNKVDEPVLVRFLQAVPEQSFVAEVLLLEPVFYREDAILAAIPGASHPQVLEHVLVQRGPSRTLTGELLKALAEPLLRPVAQRILEAFSGRVLDHLLSAFVDRDRSAAVRAQLAQLLARQGPAAVERLCSSFGPEPTSLDDEIRSVLVAMGDTAVPALQAAYSRPGWVQRITVGLFGRGGNRRAQIIRALSSLGSPAARAALQSLRASEDDPNLKLRLQQALHRLEEERLAGTEPAAPAAPATPSAPTDPAPDRPARDDDDDEEARHEQVG